jgi:Transposase DDE domain
MFLPYILHVVTLREPCKKTSGAEKAKIVLSRIKKILDVHFPELEKLSNSLTDNRKRKTYSMAAIVLGALFMFIFKETSRNAFNGDRREANFRKNFFKYFGFGLPHADTIDDVLRFLPPVELEGLKAILVGGLIEQKMFRKFRFQGKFHLVAVDATGMATFDHKHCDHCLTKTSKTGVVTYYHYVLDAKIVTTTGLSISLASEFIENDPQRDYEKQDCEQKAFVRLAAKIKKHFPRLPICILADGLYPNNPIFDICAKNNWKFIITLQDGNLKTFQTEAGLLKATAKKHVVRNADKNTRTTLEHAFLNNIEYSGNLYCWVECFETVVDKKGETKSLKHFVYITNIPQDKGNVAETARSGRLRWKIENEGFNTQKNLGYELEHKFSRISFTAMQNYYQLLQMAHMINQLVERSNQVVALLKEYSKQTIVDLWKKTIAYLLFSQGEECIPDPYQPG